MEYVNVLFSILSGFILHGTVLGVDIFEGGIPRFQCIKEVRIPINSCTKSFMEAYKETENAQENAHVNDPNTYIFLFTRTNQDSAVYLHKCPGRVPVNTHFQPDKKTVIIVHGFLENACKISWMRDMKNQFLYRSDYNVILIDWGWGNKLDYAVAVGNTEVVGKQIAFLVSGIMNQTGASSDKFHVVGHSLGGQIAGHAGKYMKEGKKFGRITGLDPAGPGYVGKSPDQRLDPSDAKLVDVIHTNAANCSILGLGYPDPVGHADFYPNGGTIQLSCITRNVGSFLKGDLFHATSALLPMVCYHQQSVHYFIASINPCGCQFIGVESNDYISSKFIRSCIGDKCAVMGLDWVDYVVKTDGRPHKYYLDTTLTCPYCADTGLRIQMKSSLGNEKHCFKA